ncbi:MAG TPA: DUF4159 domain-containing protein [Gammaproteobacteria bacterium]|nr:DUF4159 domain-containing protein [Gammaproteobacteria bacterium]
MRRELVVLATLLALLVSGLACAQFGRRFMRQVPDNDPPATEFVAMRWHFGTNGAIGHMGWSHNYPESEVHLNQFIGRTTRVDVEDESYRLLELGSPAIFDYPFAYISEPGEMEMTQAEVANLREYIDRGGFVLIDDFDTWHMDNLREEMQRVFPDRNFVRLDVTHPIWDLVYKVGDLQSMAPYVQGDDPVYYALHDNAGRIAVMALHNNDLANFWEWYGSPQYPLRPATDAFRMGTNFVIHAMTH